MHVGYDEYIMCKKGTLIVMRDGKASILKAGDPPALVAKGVVHEVCEYLRFHAYR